MDEDYHDKNPLPSVNISDFVHAWRHGTHLLDDVYWTKPLALSSHCLKPSLAAMRLHHEALKITSI